MNDVKRFRIDGFRERSIGARSIRGVRQGLCGCQLWIADGDQRGTRAESTDAVRVVLGHLSRTH
ncbi:MAG: hypothetical protein SGI84_00400 [Gemmatimonadota bacterium]|nr:hypothetical protein [Gemmatimonadota bacterium]